MDSCFDSANAGRHSGRDAGNRKTRPINAALFAIAILATTAPTSQQIENFRSGQEQKVRSTTFLTRSFRVLLEISQTLGQNASTEKRAADEARPVVFVVLTFLLSRGCKS